MAGVNGNTMTLIHGAVPPDTIARATRMAQVLRADDGRVFRIKAWRSAANVDGGVEVSADMLVSVPDEWLKKAGGDGSP